MVIDVLHCARRYIDQGRNPQLYTKECLERALAKNEQVKGKIDTLTVSIGPANTMNDSFGSTRRLFVVKGHNKYFIVMLPLLLIVIIAVIILV